MLHVVDLKNATDSQPKVMGEILGWKTIWKKKLPVKQKLTYMVKGGGFRSRRAYPFTLGFLSWV